MMWSLLPLPLFAVVAYCFHRRFVSGITGEVYEWISRNLGIDGLWTREGLIKPRRGRHLVKVSRGRPFKKFRRTDPDRIRLSSQ